jgi:hypothetical protein
MATLLKPAMERDARERTRFAQTQAAPAGGGPSAAPRLRVAQDDAHERSLAQQLQRAEATMVASEPVHFHDLKESAHRKTQELLAAERAVLHFRAYTMERVDNSPLENERARVMEFFFRIADGCVAPPLARARVRACARAWPAAAGLLPLPLPPLLPSSTRQRPPSYRNAVHHPTPTRTPTAAHCTSSSPRRRTAASTRATTRSATCRSRRTAPARPMGRATSSWARRSP